MLSARDFVISDGNFQMEKAPVFVWAKIPGGRTDSMAFCMELMEKAGVIVTPGASFGCTTERATYVSPWYFRRRRSGKQWKRSEKAD